MSASRSAKSIMTTSVSGSADLCDAMHTNILPRTFSAGFPHVAVTSTSGNVRPMASTGLNLLPRGIGDRLLKKTKGILRRLRIPDVPGLRARRRGRYNQGLHFVLRSDAYWEVVQR